MHSDPGEERYQLRQIHDHGQKRAEKEESVHMHSDKSTMTDENFQEWRTRNVWIFFLASLFSDWGHEMVTALMPGLLVALGAPAIALGVVEGVSNLGQAWAAIWGGRVNDRRHGRYFFLIGGYVLTGIKALMAIVPSWPWIVLLRTVGWIGRGVRGPIRDAYIAEEVSSANVGKAYGLREAFDTIGALLGPLTAALFVTFVRPATAIAWTAVPAALTVAVIIRLRRLPEEPAARPVHELGEGVSLPRTRGYTRYLWSTLLFSMGYLAPTFFILRVWNSAVTVEGLSPHALALLLYALHNGVYAVTAYPVGWISDHLSAQSLLRLGYGVWSLVLLGFAFGGAAASWWIVLFALAGLATGIIEVSQKMTTVKLVPKDFRGTGLGQVAAVRGVGQLGAGLVMGGLWSLIGARSGFVGEAALALAGLALLWVGPRLGS